MNPGRECKLSMGYLEQAPRSATASLVGWNTAFLILKVTYFVIHGEQVDSISSLGPSNSEGSLVNDSLRATYRHTL